MKGYLLDVNVISAWFQQNPNVVDRVNNLPPDAIVKVSVITLGELEFSHCLYPATRDQSRIRKYREFIQNQFPAPFIAIVTQDVTAKYGAIRAALAHTNLSNHKRVEAWKDKVTGHELGIDENDLWIAAQAAESNLVLATNDKMKRIMDAAIAAGVTLKAVDWLSPPSQDGC